MNRIQVKVQAVAGTTPTPLLHGEIGINTGDTPPSVWVGDAANTPTKVGPAIVAAQAPVGPAEGTLWFEPTGPSLSVYESGMWHAVGGIQTITTPSANPVTDAGKVVALGPDGKIPPAFMAIPGGMNYRGQFDVTAATLPTTPAAGDYIMNSAAGNPNAAWTGLPAGTNVALNSLVVFDGTNWHDVGSNLNMDSFLPLAGGTMDSFAIVHFAVPAGAAPATPPTRLDGVAANKSAIDNFTLAAGVLPLPTLAAITATPTAVAADACDIVFAGGPADKAYTVTLTYTTNVGGGQTKTVPVQAHDTADMVANRAVAAITGDIVATKIVAGTIHVTLGTATSLTTMQAAVA